MKERLMTRLSTTNAIFPYKKLRQAISAVHMSANNAATPPRENNSYRAILPPLTSSASLPSPAPQYLRSSQKEESGSLSRLRRLAIPSKLYRLSAGQSGKDMGVS